MYHPLPGRRLRSNLPSGGEDRLGRQDVPTDGIGQGVQQSGALADPDGQGGAVKVEPLTVEDLALPMKRQMVGILADEHIGQEARPWTTAFDQPPEVIGAVSDRQAPKACLARDVNQHLMPVSGNVDADQNTSIRSMFNLGHSRSPLWCGSQKTTIET
ncbi:MAG: hypothetical protein KDK01_11285 [Rhodobacteraceae bacterium]|nr:hypothetical protein [Paracoccaceae bacterium]